MIFRLLSSDVSQKPEGNQRACKRVIRSHTRQGRSLGLVAHPFPKLDGWLQGSRVYPGHLSKLKGCFNGQVCQVCRQRKGVKRIAGRFDRGQSRYAFVHPLELRIISPRDQKGFGWTSAGRIKSHYAPVRYYRSYVRECSRVGGTRVDLPLRQFVLNQ